jgi:hypothetical protein
LVLYHAFLLDMVSSVLLFHPGHIRLLYLAPRGLACYTQAIVMPNVAASPQKPARYLSAREKRGYVKVRGKLPYTTGCNAIPQNDGKPLSF